MFLIATNSIKTLPKNDGIVCVQDIQPYETFFIEADVATGKLYLDQSYDTITPIIRDSNVNVEHVYFYQVLSHPEFSYPHTCVPKFFIRAARSFLEKQSVPTEYSDRYCCFSMMNTRRPNRLLVSAWLSQNQHINFNYTQGWQNQDFDFLQTKECTRLTTYKLDSLLDKKFTIYKEDSSHNITTITRYSMDDLNYIWNNILSRQFQNSTFNIVTEPHFWEKACSITEKYLQCLYGCCFPIFCGGYGIADQLTRIGFDVFDDIIDHSYQYVRHPGKRVLDALELNRKLLEDHSVKKLDHMDRHMKNLSLVRENLATFEKQFNNNNAFAIWEQYKDVFNSPFY